MTKAVESVAVFATEWGTCDASGDGTLNFEETKTWLLGLLWHAVAICSLGFGTVWVIIDTCWEMLSIPTWCYTLRSECMLRHDETCLRLDFFERLNISDANWAVSDKQEACSALFAGCQWRRWMERLWLGVDFYVETKKQQQSTQRSLDVWTSVVCEWINVDELNHEARTRCATFINNEDVMSHDITSQDVTRCLRWLKILKI